MASTLPHHILSYIGTHVREEDRLACALVCKHWTEPFLDAYWGKLKISNDTTDIITLISNKASLINAHRVWAVEFPDVRLNSYERLLEFQRSFPGIRYVHFTHRIPNEIDFSDVIDWSLWKNLTHLHINIDVSFETLSFQRIFTNLSVLSCLVHFTLERPFLSHEPPPISWNDFESLNYHLPRLEYLKHGFSFKPITRDDIESIRAVEPAQTITRIEFNTDVNHLWLFYFASKYPNLRYFINNQYISSNEYPIDCARQQYQSNLQLISTLDQFFPCLKRADVLLTHYNKYLWFIFFETLGQFGTKIEHVRLSYVCPIENDTISRCIQPISESLKFLDIYLRTHGTMRFVVCPRLVRLRIKESFDSKIEVDAILECFPSLRSLSLSKIKISLSTNPHTYTPHPLQKLKIDSSVINNDALHYLSLRCNQLKHMTLVNIRYHIINTSYPHKYEVKDNDEPRQLILDMSMLNLDIFILGFIYTFSRDLKVYPKHYVIEQMENDNDILQATQQPTRMNWYHVCCDRTNRKQNILEWELGKRDIEFCQRYFKDFSRRRKRGKERRDIKKDRLGFVQKRFWKKDLKHGVLVFRFKSVKNHIYRIKKEIYNSIR